MQLRNIAAFFGNRVRAVTSSSTVLDSWSRVSKQWSISREALHFSCMYNKLRESRYTPRMINSNLS